MKVARLLCLTPLLIVFLSPWIALAQTPAPTNAAPATSNERFLVIVETSAAMQKRAENVQKTIGSIISSGLKGEMASGSTVGLWTFNEQLATGQLPLQLWKPETRQRVALALVQFLQQQKNEKAGRLGSVLDAVTNVVAKSEHITLLLVTSGSEPVKGTPYDAEIAEAFSKNSEQQRKSNMPFLTILRAAQGKFVAFAVNMPPWPLEVPEYPSEFKPMVVVPPAPPKIAPVEPPPIKRPTPGVLSPTNTIYLVETTPPTSDILTNTTAVEPRPGTNVNAAVETSTPTNTNHPAAVASVNDTSAAAPVLARESLGAAVAKPANSKLPIITILIIGICALLAIMVVFIVLLRWSRRSSGESLITRSMNRGDR